MQDYIIRLKAYNRQPSHKINEEKHKRRRKGDMATTFEHKTQEMIFFGHITILI